jgi:hypothetical protein
MVWGGTACAFCGLTCRAYFSCCPRKSQGRQATSWPTYQLGHRRPILCLGRFISCFSYKRVAEAWQSNNSFKAASPPLNSSVRPMGPLFSIAVVLLVGLLVLGVAFGIARVFHPPLIALAAAFAFVVGGAAGSAFFGLVSWLAIGATTLTSHWQVFSYLAMLVASAVFGGLCTTLLFLGVVRRSNSSFKADAQKARAT